MYVINYNLLNCKNILNLKYIENYSSQVFNNIIISNYFKYYKLINVLNLYRYIILIIRIHIIKAHVYEIYHISNWIFHVTFMT